MIPEELCRKATKKLGKEHQLNMVIEECSELILAIQKYRRGESELHVVREAVDVSNMIDQLRTIFPTMHWQACENTTIHKLEGILHGKKNLKEPFITVYESIGGWKAKMMAWYEDDQIWDNVCTSMAFENKEKATKYGKDWAEAEEIKFKEHHE